MPKARIYRDVDGARIEGVTRPIFIRNGADYYLSDLEIYADGSIYCWEWVDLAGLRGKLASGWVATSFEPGAQATAHQLVSWRFAEPESWVTPEALLGEVTDEIDRLNDRPTAAQRCLRAVDRYLRSRSEGDRAALVAAYQAIPEHLRRYALGDMDAKDRPLRVLCAGIGGQLAVPWEPFHEPVTEQAYQEALDYFAKRRQAADEVTTRVPHDGPASAESPTVHLPQRYFPGGWPKDAGTLVLRNEYPAPIVVDATSYPTVVHAYWALAVDDPAVAEWIRTAERPYDARKAAERVAVRPGWPVARTAVMARLLRAKFAQHPHLAQVLLATGDGRIEYDEFDSPHWSSHGPGRSWLGRLLELIRAELAAERQ